MLCRGFWACAGLFSQGTEKRRLADGREGRDFGKKQPDNSLIGPTILTKWN
jgi:hypothetical protein